MADEIMQFNVVKFTDDNKSTIGGYLVRFTGPEHRDLQGEFFTAETDLGENIYPQIPLMYQHGFDSVLRLDPIGKIISQKKDDVGLWVQAQLDMAHEFFEDVQFLIDEGILGWSSGAWPQSVAIDNDGKITRWRVIEGSLTPTPAEPFTVGNVEWVEKYVLGSAGADADFDSTEESMIKWNGTNSIYNCEPEKVLAAYKSVGLPPPDLLKMAGRSKRDAAIENKSASDNPGVANQKQIKAAIPPSNEDEDMPTQEEIQAMIAAGIAEASKVAADEAAKAEQDAKIADADKVLAENETLKKQLAEKNAKPAKVLPGSTTPVDGDPPAKDDDDSTKVSIVVGSHYDELSIEDMAFGLTIFKDYGGYGVTKRIRPSERYANALSSKLERKNLVVPNPAGGFYKSDELNHSTQSSYGDEWVPDLWSNDLWRRARLENPILSMFRSIEMPSDPYNLPIESTDPTVYFVGETEDEAQLTIASSASAIPDSKVGSGKLTMNAQKLALRVGFSAELTEDSIIPILNMYREQAMRAMLDAIDNVILNGDTTNATGNINSYDADPADTLKFLAMDGLRHLPLVTTTANSKDMGGVAPTLSKFRQTRFTMAGKYSVNPSRLAWIMDAQTFGAALNLDEFITMDKAGPHATALTGTLGFLDGIPVNVSAEMALTRLNGSVYSSANTLGQAVCVYRPGWIVGYRRRIAIAIDYLSYYDSYQMTATVRLALNRFDADVAGVLYNIKV